MKKDEAMSVHNRREDYMNRSRDLRVPTYKRDALQPFLRKPKSKQFEPDDTGKSP